jgi:tripartite-type tricarboxylate transporter receptor subunit TctC
MEKSISMVAMIAIAVSLANIANAYAQPYPTRPITLGTPFAASGPGDTLPRILAEPKWWPIIKAANI